AKTGDWLMPVALSANGSRLAVADGSTINVWDLPSHKRLAVIPSTLSETKRHGMALSPDGSLLGIVSFPEITSVWSVATGSRLWSARKSVSASAVAFSADDGRLVVAGFLKTTVCDAATGQVLCELQEKDFTPVCIALSPDGLHLAEGDGDGVV